MDILTAIDTATGCLRCGEPLGASPSDDFCQDECQQTWHADRVEPLRGYVEPWDRPWDFPGIGRDVHVSVAPAGFRLPRETGDLAADLRAANRASAAATTDAQREAVALRVVSLTARTNAVFQPLTAAVCAAVKDVTEWLSDMGQRLRVIDDALQRPDVTDDRMGRAGDGEPQDVLGVEPAPRATAGAPQK